MDQPREAVKGCVNISGGSAGGGKAFEPVWKPPQRPRGETEVAALPPSEIGTCGILPEIDKTVLKKLPGLSEPGRGSLPIPTFGFFPNITKQFPNPSWASYNSV